MTQGELAVDLPPRLFTATPSKLDSWLDCPRRYRFAYVDRPSPPKGPPWAHNSLGGAVHTVLAAWWCCPSRAGRCRPPAASFTRSGSRSASATTAQAEEWRARAADMVERYVETLDPTEEPLGVERTVGDGTPRLALSGRIDRLDRRGDELVVVDYKTGRHCSAPTMRAVRSRSRSTPRRPHAHCDCHAVAWSCITCPLAR